MAIDLSVDAPIWQWDIVAINMLGSALLGALIGWYSRQATPWWLPGIGAGVLGGFTTFSAMAAPHPHGPVPGAILLVATLVCATASAGLGWRAGSAFAAHRGYATVTRSADQVESEVEGFDIGTGATA